MPRPNVAGLALNLDGCRFGDSPRGGGRQRRRTEEEQRHVDEGQRSDGADNGKLRPRGEASREENLHPNQRRDQDISKHDGRRHGGLGEEGGNSPLSTHHYNHRPQYSNHHHNSNANGQNGSHQHSYPPSPLGTTYRHEGLSIGRNFLRFQGSTLSEKLSLDDLIIEGCVGRGVCSSVWRARRRSNDEVGGVGGADCGLAGADNSVDANNNSGSNNVQGEEYGVGNGDADNSNDDSTTYYALKLFPLRDPSKRSMLIRELKLLCSFSCDCLVELEGAFLDSEDGGGGNTVTLVLEYMDRGSLEDLVNVDNSREKGRKVPENAIAAIAYQMLWGLSYLHHEGVLHRDIKPANVLVSSSGRVKLADFGIVSQQRSLDDTDGTIMNHTVVGTTRYMSPERLRGGPYARSSDVWGAGLVLLEIVRGDSPFDDVSSVVELVQTLDECDMAEFVPEGASDGLREVLLGCLNREPRKRIPASVLLSSPWFRVHGIEDVEDAASLMMSYLDGDQYQ